MDEIRWIGVYWDPRMNWWGAGIWTSTGMALKGGHRVDLIEKTP